MPVETQPSTEIDDTRDQVAFTAKGGCPLKPCFQHFLQLLPLNREGSIHRQGWVPVETPIYRSMATGVANRSSIHRQGWVPVETYGEADVKRYGVWNV